MKKIDLYRKQIKAFETTRSSFTTKQKTKFNEKIIKEQVNNFGVKPGKFAELCIREVIEDSGFTFKKAESISNLPSTIKKKSLEADGYVMELDVYLESKNYTCGSSGTANEKLYGWLAKLQYYDKPCVLIFAGEHELRLHSECNHIWEAYHDNPDYRDLLFSNAIRYLRDSGKLFLTTLSGLETFIKGMEND